MRLVNVDGAVGFVATYYFALARKENQVPGGVKRVSKLQVQCRGVVPWTHWMAIVTGMADSRVSR